MHPARPASAACSALSSAERPSALRGCRASGCGAQCVVGRATAVPQRPRLTRVGRRAGGRAALQRPVDAPRAAEEEEGLAHAQPVPEGNDAAVTASDPPAEQQGGYGEPASLWALTLLGLCYLHASACAYALPALLPDVALELTLDDAQSAALTFAFTLTYSLFLIPAGAAADTLDRPQLLAAGVTLWSAGTALSAVAPTFPVLLASRLLYAAGYATQNPVSFGIIPELFPRRRASAMAAYNVAIHLGRAVSFGGGALAAPTHDTPQAVPSAVEGPPGDGWQELVTLPLARLADVAALGGMTILYLSGDNVVLSPALGGGESGVSIGETAQAAASAALAAAGMSWRDVMLIIAAPGMLLAPLLLLTVKDPGRTGDGSRATRRRVRAAQRMARMASAVGAGALARTTNVLTPRRVSLPNTKAVVPPPPSSSQVVENLRSVVASSPWRLVTAAAVLNDFGAWALIAFQATFYERVFGLEASAYSPALALILPLGGVLGGLGGSIAVDRLTALGLTRYRRYLLAGASLLAAPAMAASLLAPDAQTSLAMLLPAAALAEVWRAPTSVMVREAAPRGVPGAAVAAHLACRNALCGLGPIAAAWLARGGDLRHALLLTPAAFAAAAALFWAAEGALETRLAEAAASRGVLQLPAASAEGDGGGEE